MQRFFVLGLLGLGLFLTSHAQVAEYGKAPQKAMEGLLTIKPSELTESPLMAMPQEEDTFATYVFTLTDIVIFSYEDSTNIVVQRGNGTAVWSGILNADEYRYLAPGQGVFTVISNKKYSVLIGDPISSLVQGWYAVDQNNRCVSEKLLTVTPGSYGTAEFMVFAYEDSTYVEIREASNGSLIQSKWLNKAGVLRRPADYARAVSVTGTKPISALSYGDQGFWVPSSNGTFSGRLFYTWVGNMEGWLHDLMVIAYNDETHVKITNTETKNVIWEGNLDDGENYAQNIANQLITVESDKNVVCIIAPLISYSGGYYRLYIGMEASGEGIGTKFYHPTISGSQLVIFSFYDNNKIRIYDHKGGGALVWSGTLNSGGSQMLSTAYTTYRVESDRGVALFDAWGDEAGAEFAPLWFAVHPAVAVLPDQERTTEPGVGVHFGAVVENNGNYHDIMDISYVNTYGPDFTTQLTDNSSQSLSDHDGDGIPDTDTLLRGETFILNANVSPSDTVPFGSVDTLKLMVRSFQDTTKMDTAYLLTHIRGVEINLDSNWTVAVEPGDTAEFALWASTDMRYRTLDTFNLTWSDTKGNPLAWPVMVRDSLDGTFTDTDGDGSPDIPDVPRNGVLVPFSVRVGTPDSATAGDQIVVTVAITSADFPLQFYPGVTDTVLLTVNIMPVPEVEILPDQRDSVRAGQTIAYPLEVRNWGNGEDVPEITIQTTQPSWVHRLLAADSVSNLVDTDGDATPDVGSLSGVVQDTIPGRGWLFLEVTPPYSTPSGLLDSAIVYAHSSVDPAEYDSAIIVTGIMSVVDIDIEPDTQSIIGPDEEAVYLLRVTNRGGAADTIAIATYPLPDLGWNYTLRFADDNSDLVDTDLDGMIDVGSVDSGQTVVVRLGITPHDALGTLVGDIDTSVVETRYVWIRTRYTNNPDSANDSVKIVTIFEPLLDIHNYPNPFSVRNGTTFAYMIPRAGYVTLRIYNRAGEHIRTLINNEHYDLGGVFEMYWDGLTENGQQSSPGVYLYNLEWLADDATGLAKTKRIIKKALLQP